MRGGRLATQQDLGVGERTKRPPRFKVKDVSHTSCTLKTIVKEFVGADGKRKLQVFRRDDGSFGFESLRFSEEPLEMCWIPDGRFSECFAPTADVAELEARGRIDWLRDQN